MTTAESGAALWAKTGRPLPEPELPRPTLDPDLPPYEPSQRVSGRLAGTATDILPLLAARWTDAFRAFHPDVEIEVPPPYGGGPGAKRLIEGSADFSFQSRELRPVDLQEFVDTRGYAPLLIPISGGSWRHYGFLDALTVIVHESNPLQRISYRQLDALFSSTRARGGTPIRIWGELGVSGAHADRAINVFAPRPWNGYEEFVRQRVLSHAGVRGEWRDDLTFVDLVIPVPPAVARDPDSLGYTGMAFLVDGVKSLEIAEADGGPFLPPSQEAVASGRYPLSRIFYIVVDKEPGRTLDPLLVEWIRFILSRDGQQQVVEHGVFDPLRAEALRRSLALLENAT